MKKMRSNKQTRKSYKRSGWGSPFYYAKSYYNKSGYSRSFKNK